MFDRLRLWTKIMLMMGLAIGGVGAVLTFTNLTNLTRVVQHAERSALSAHYQAIANAVAPQASAAKAGQGMQVPDPASITAPALQVGGSVGIGSNMYGFGTAGTGDASPLLFGNPHWYWKGPDRFYQAHLTIPGELNVSGASFLGLPMVQIGFNDNVAWSHTVSTARRFGFFQLTLAPNDPTSYLLDGQAVKMKANPITVEVRQASGATATVSRTLYKTEYGPMVNLASMNPALGWNTVSAFAMRDINGENFRSMRNWLRWRSAWHSGGCLS